jgi:hypothetical protein
MQVLPELEAVGQLGEAPPIQPAFGASETGSDCGEIHIVAISYQLSALSYQLSAASIQRHLLLGADS